MSAAILVNDSEAEIARSVRQAIRARHYSPKTEESYVYWIKRFIFFHCKKHPAEMGETEIGRFLSSFATQAKVSASTQNQAKRSMLSGFFTRRSCRERLL